MKKVVLYSDGACEGNPGPGGWAVILAYGLHQKEISGAEPATTNNRMELTAAVEGLKALKEPCEIEFFTDSQYVQNGISEWLKDWKLQGWKTKERKAVKNEDLWQELDVKSAKHQITWRWLKGHAGHEMNERCDLLARNEILKLRQKFSPEQLKVLLEGFRRNSDDAAINGKLPSLG